MVSSSQTTTLYPGLGLLLIAERQSAPGQQPWAAYHSFHESLSVHKLWNPSREYNATEQEGGPRSGRLLYPHLISEGPLREI